MQSNINSYFWGLVMAEMTRGAQHTCAVVEGIVAAFNGGMTFSRADQKLLDACFLHVWEKFHLFLFARPSHTPIELFLLTAAVSSKSCNLVGPRKVSE